MSAFPKKCIELEDQEAFKAINKRLEGQMIRLQWMTTGGLAMVVGKVHRVKSGNTLKDIQIFPLREHMSSSRIYEPMMEIPGLHANTILKLKRYRNEAHMISEYKKLLTSEQTKEQ